MSEREQPVGADVEETAAGEPDEAEEAAANAAEEAEEAEEAKTEPSEPEQLRVERDRYLDLAQRAQADLENLRKRLGRETGDAERRGRAAVVKDLAPAIDNLERALLAAGIDLDGADPNAIEPVSEEVSARRALAEGVALVYREMTGALRRSGVESFDPTGEPFDPGMHEAVQTLAAGEENSGRVVETLARGYRIDDHVLRAASVVVGE